jgi:alcohol dehydrogenase (cytochrome c)
MKARWTRRGLGTTAGLLAAGLAAGACGGTPATSENAAAPKPLATASWPYPNGDLSNTRDATGSTITSGNVSGLKQAWTFHITGSAASGVGSVGALAANPIIVDGVVYIQDLDANVYALGLATGRLLWQYHLGTPMKSGPGPDGVAVVDGAVYGISPTTAFALNAHTGKKLWVDSHLLNAGQGTFEIQPQVADGRVYLASAYGSGSGGGVLLALNAANGAVQWRFNSVLSRDAGVHAIGLGSGGAWETPLVSSDGSVTFGIGNPYQSVASAVAHPSAQLYTDSDVNLDAATGKLRWYYQGVPNDFMDHDMQASPISARVNGVSVVLGGGKMGYVYEMNARTGTLIWKTPVGEHNGQDDDSLLALQHRFAPKVPFTIAPGPIGGILTDMAVDGPSVYVVTNDLPFVETNLKLPVPVKSAGPLAGEVEALNLATGKVEWDTKVHDLPVGATTVSNNLVFTTLYHGVLIALNRSTGAIVFRRRLPTTTNAPIAIAGNTVIVPAGGPATGKSGGGGHPQVVAYTVAARSS